MATTPNFGSLLGRAKKAKPVVEIAAVAEPGGEEDPVKERVKPIAQDLLDAVRGGDVDALADALIAAHKAGNAGASDSADEYEAEENAEGEE
jgi:hypothetical protein